MIELESIDGIGPKTKELINKLGINTAEDLINHYHSAMISLKEVI